MEKHTASQGGAAVKRVLAAALAAVLIGLVATPVFAASRCFYGCDEPKVVQRAWSAPPRKVVQPGSDLGEAAIAMMAMVGAVGGALAAPSPWTVLQAAAAVAYVIKVNPQRPVYEDQRSGISSRRQCWPGPCPQP